MAKWSEENQPGWSGRCNGRTARGCSDMRIWIPIIATGSSTYDRISIRVPTLLEEWIFYPVLRCPKITFTDCIDLAVDNRIAWKNMLGVKFKFRRSVSSV